MDYESVKELINIINVSELNAFELEMDNVKIRMSKNGGRLTEAQPDTKQTESEQTVIIEDEVKPIEESPAKNDCEEGHIVKSPIVGSLYTSQAPDKPPIVKLRDKVKAGDLLCIVEAMKVMNEIVSTHNGTVAKIYAENGQLVEYGQPLFKIVE